MPTTKAPRNTLSIRLTAKIKDDLITRFRAGERLPSERQLAATLSVSPVTISRVMQQLRADGVVYRIPNSGTYLCADQVPKQHAAPESRGNGRVIEFDRLSAPSVTVQMVILASLACLLPEADTGKYTWGHDLITAIECEVQRSGGKTAIVDPTVIESGGIANRLTALIRDSANCAALIPAGLKPETIGEIWRLQAMLGPTFPIMHVTTPKLDAFHRVEFDWSEAVAVVTSHLLALGHRRIGLIGPNAESQEWITGRAAAFKSMLRASGVDVADSDIVLSHADYHNDPAAPGYLIGKLEGGRLLDAQGFTALVGANDNIAIGILDAAAERGLNVPHDLSVIGIDNAPISAIKNLTTVNLPLTTLGCQVARTASELLMQGSAGVRRAVLVPPTLVVRGSTAVPSSVR